MMRRFNSGLRKYYSGYSNQFLNAQDNTNYMQPNNVQTYNTNVGNNVPLDNIGNGVDVSNSVQPASVSAPTATTSNQGAGGAKQFENFRTYGGIFSTIGKATQNLASAAAGPQDEYGVYKTQGQAVLGAYGNMGATMKAGQELRANSGDYAYLSGEGKNKIKAAGVGSMLSFLGWGKGAADMNRIRRKARDRTLDLQRQQQSFQQGLDYSDTRQGNIDRYGTTFANGGNLGNANTTFFKAGGSTHENGGVSIGGNKEIEKNEVVYNGYVFSDRLPYKK